MSCQYAILLLLAVSAPCCFAAQPIAGCLQSTSVPIAVRMAGGPSVAALLEAGIETPLRLVDAATHRQLWSAGDNGATQVFRDMDSGFFGSIAAIDLDADGLHDRIYAGDIAGRLWRFDVHHDAAAPQWTSGGILADFANDQGRGFIAPPDVILSSPPGGRPWLNIAIGTAAPGNPSASNRFYVVRDHAPFDTWSDDDFESWKPVREEDLMKVSTAQASAEAANVVDPEMPGWYIELGSGHVIAPSVTVNHRVVLGIAEAIPRTGPCEILTRIASLELEQGRVVPDVSSPDKWTRLLPVPVLLSDRFEIGEVHGTVAPCSLGGQLVAACDVDTRPRKTWWRREDAE
jgi:hypothetical protein